MALRPPQHPPDGPIVFVHSSDSAWDNDRVEAEQAQMRQREEDPRRHPVVRYQDGWTRYALDAPATVGESVVTVREYLDEAKAPVFWHLRRLSLHEWYEIKPLWDRAVAQGETRPRQCYLRCCWLGLQKVENGPTLELPNGRPSQADLDRLFAIHPDLPRDIGEAVYQASMPLTAEEGKRSG